jgi:hypothetical protein
MYCLVSIWLAIIGRAGRYQQVQLVPVAWPAAGEE